MLSTDKLFTIKEASEWATKFIGKDVTHSDISYLIQDGLIKKIEDNGTTRVSQTDLLNYYNSYNNTGEENLKEQSGCDVNRALSFDQYKESETNKHVHRLHPYKGKFIPQLVEYFLDNRTDYFKTETFFNKGDIILDPFSGSGTTMVQSCELGMNAIGIDISAFNTLIGNCKVSKYDIADLLFEVKRITNTLQVFVQNSNVIEFEDKLLQKLYTFNTKYFPVPDYKNRLINQQINEKEYAEVKEKQFLSKFEKLVGEYNIKLQQEKNDSFLDKWYSQQIRDEIDLVFEEIKKIENINIKNFVNIILSRAIRSCMATTHADFATLQEPVTTTYYCQKHSKICKPLFSILNWWKTCSKDSIKRLLQFEKLRTNTYQLCLTGDSRNIDVLSQVQKSNPEFGQLLEKQKIKGIFSSPPYVGLIDYHEQHAYAYDLFGLERNDELEIGPQFKGQDEEAKQSYIQGISDALNNCKKYLANDYHVFLVANDKFNMYPAIAENAGMKIVNRFKRPALNRTEKDKTAYSEIIFHLKEK